MLNSFGLDNKDVEHPSNYCSNRQFGSAIRVYHSLEQLAKL